MLQDVFFAKAIIFFKFPFFSKLIFLKISKFLVKVADLSKKYNLTKKIFLIF